MKPLDLEMLKEAFRDRRVHTALGVITKLMLAPDRSALRVMVSIFPEGREIQATMTWEHVGPDSGFFQFPVVNDLVLVAFADGDEEFAFVIKRLASKEDKIPTEAATGDTVVKTLNGKNFHLIVKKDHLSTVDEDATRTIGGNWSETVEGNTSVTSGGTQSYVSDGDALLESTSGKAKIEGETRVNLCKPGSNPTENLVLGQQLKTLLSDLMSEISDLATAFASHKHEFTNVLGFTPSPNNGSAGSAVASAVDDLKASPVEDGEILSDLAFTEKGS